MNTQKKFKERIIKMQTDGRNIRDQLYPCFNCPGRYSFFGCPSGRFSIRIGVGLDVYPCIYSNEMLGSLKWRTLKLFGINILKEFLWRTLSVSLVIGVGDLVD